jgi:hypothetical protein
MHPHKLLDTLGLMPFGGMPPSLDRVVRYLGSVAQAVRAHP